MSRFVNQRQNPKLEPRKPKHKHKIESIKTISAIIILVVIIGLIAFNKQLGIDVASLQLIHTILGAILFYLFGSKSND